MHNGIEYGLMAAYAEGLGVLKAANIGKQAGEVDAETTPLRDPEHYQYDLNLPDIAEVWRRGSVIASWLLDLSAAALVAGSAAGEISPAGCRIPAKAAGPSRPRSMRACRPMCCPRRFTSGSASRGEADFADKLLSAMRYRVRRTCRAAGEILAIGSGAY